MHSQDALDVFEERTRNDNHGSPTGRCMMIGLEKAPLPARRGISAISAEQNFQSLRASAVPSRVSLSD
jgi:hypothetical protein